MDNICNIFRVMKVRKIKHKQDKIVNIENYIQENYLPKIKAK